MVRIVIGILLMLIYFLGLIFPVAEGEDYKNYAVGGFVIYLIPGALLIYYGYKSWYGKKQPGYVHPQKSIKVGPRQRPQSQTTNITFQTNFINIPQAEKILRNSNDVDERISAVSALGKINHEKAVRVLCDALANDSDQYVRALCAGYLGCKKGPKAEKALLNAVNDTSLIVQEKLIEALFRIGTGGAFNAINEFAKSKNTKVKEKAEHFLFKRSKKITKKIECPFLTIYGTCEPPETPDLFDCSWETQGKGYYSSCYVYQMKTFKGGAAEFLKKL
ncbi:MAG: HEAT repeat domain-containing protein [Bacteroidota bacterium]